MVSNSVHIKIAGLLDSRWTHLLPEWTVQPQSDDTTLISGRNCDQSSIHGLLCRIRDFNLELVSVYINNSRE